MTKVYFTADLHLGHKGILDLCQRPFSSVDDMNEQIIERWNGAVRPKDHVYVLGDVSFATIEETDNMLTQLRGKKFLVAGNHDKAYRTKEPFAKHFEWVKDYHEIKLQEVKGSQMIVMSHYPFASWNKSYAGSFMLHGHSHGSMQKASEHMRRYDVGVDANDFTPIAYEQIRERLLNKSTSG